MTQVACEGHQELRDMVIELRADVKHIDQKISELADMAKTNHSRTIKLEAYNNQAIGVTQGIRNSAATVSVVVSVVISVVAIVVSAVFR